MKEKLNSFDELGKFFDVKTFSYNWYNWKQSLEKTINEVSGLLLNDEIKSEEVEIVDEFGRSRDIVPLKDLVEIASSQNLDVISLENKIVKTPKVRVENYGEYEARYKRDIGLYSKKRPWIINQEKNKNIGLKFIFDGYPRSSDKKEEGDNRNSNELFHKNHSEIHTCQLMLNGRVLKSLRKSIEIEYSNYVCEERDRDFLSKLENE